MKQQIVLRVAGFWLAYAAIFVVMGLFLGMVPPSTRLLAAGTVITAVTLAITFVLVRNERSSMGDVGAAWSAGSPARFGAGFVVGTAMVVLLGALTVAVSGSGSLQRVESTSTGALPLAVLTYVALSAGEETGFRGYPFRRLRQAFGTWPAQLVVALAFAGYHMVQGWPPVNALVGTTAGSVLFGVATIVSGGLAFPIGLHAAWNVGTWAIGTKPEAGLWKLQLAREPSLIASFSIYLGVMAVTAAGLLLWRRSRSADVNGERP